ncbi:MAG TPA: hypothetical protein VKN73_00240, partial [Desulfosalsimonadaceae bacterium]|nr:hypothetical protein [Desulfosalsimonadaceae bacterium]
DPKRLKDLIEQISKSQNHMGRLAREKDKIGEALSQTDSALRRRVKETGICPTCGQPIDAEHFMKTALNSSGSSI